MLPVLSVSDFVEQINDIILGEFVIEGEVSQYKISQGKWVFFDLKDDRATINCFAVVYQVGQTLSDGMKVRVVGYPKIYEKNGRFSLTVQKIQLVGEGDLKKAYEILKQKLLSEGLFDVNRKREFTFLPKKIGVIASRDSAAFGDFVRIVDNRFKGVEILLFNVAVQGQSAAEEIVLAFEYFNSCETGAEVIALIRGGGSLEDLAAFNDERVARAVYASRVPTICGVGHERDESLCDLVADKRASTPSNAAEIVVPDKNEIIRSLDFSLEHIFDSVRHSIHKEIYEVDQKMYTIVSSVEGPVLKAKSLLEKFDNLPSTFSLKVSVIKNYILAADRLFKNVDPKLILKRGFSIVRDSGGSIVKDSLSLDNSEEFMVELAKGSIKGKVI